MQIVGGCTDPLACNYDSTATFDDGSCLYNVDACGNCGGTSTSGCINPAACNYDPLASCDDGSCLIIGSFCDDGNPCTQNDLVIFNCMCIGNPVPDGTPCDDGDPTTVTVCIAATCTIVSFDMDLDGFDSTVDCDDNNNQIYPGALEICDGIDNNCDGVIDEGLSLDLDGDGYTAVGSCSGTANDCDDNNNQIYPGAPEICDGIDNNCDGIIDGGLFVDLDGDGFTAVGSCSGTANDCDDNNNQVYPGAPEICDGLDNNCDGVIDEGLSFDLDNDGFTAIGSCSGTANDCDDTNNQIYPGAPEFCDGIDNNCNGVIDEGLLADTDLDGLSDCDETSIYFTDPFAADTDHDGLSDGLEVLESFTDPLLQDTNGDGCNDNLEYSNNCPGSPTTCPGDLNFDGNINTPDLLMFLGSFGLTCP